MTAKEYLNQAYLLDQQVNSKLRQAEYLRDLAQKITSNYGGEVVSHSRNVNARTDAVDKLIDTERAMDAEIDRLVETRMRISDVIAQVRNESYRLILEKRYLEFLSWEQIAVDMSYSIRWLHKMHNRALDVVDRILEGDECA